MALDSFTWPPDKPVTEEDKEEALLDRYEEDHSFAQHEEDFAASTLPHPTTPFEKKLLDRAKMAAAQCYLKPTSPLYADAVMVFIQKALRVVEAPRDEDADWAMRYRCGYNEMSKFLRKRRRRLDQTGSNVVSISLLTETSTRADKDDDGGPRYDYDTIASNRFIPPHLAAMQSEFDDAVKRAVDDLPMRQRQVFELTVRKRIPGQEVADRLMMDPATVTRDKQDVLAALERRLRPFFADGTVEELLQWQGRPVERPGLPGGFEDAMYRLMKGDK